VDGWAVWAGMTTICSLSLAAWAAAALEAVLDQEVEAIRAGLADASLRLRLRSWNVRCP